LHAAVLYSLCRFCYIFLKQGTNALEKQKEVLNMFGYGRYGWDHRPPRHGGCGCGCGSMLLIMLGLLFLTALRYVILY
jgi:hypothetical protein